MDLQPQHLAAPASVDRVVRTSRDGMPMLVIHGRFPVGGGRFELVVFELGFERRVTTREIARA